MGQTQFVIVGGGIGGLAVSAALAQTRAEVTLLERSSFADESGAGIQLGPNATRALRELGLLEAVEAHAARPEALWLFDARSGKRLATMPLGRELEARYGAPYLTLHRADLHEALLKSCQDHASLELRPDFEVTAVEDRGAIITAKAADGRAAEGSILIGADGLWSAVRARVAPGVTPRSTGRTAWRALLPLGTLPSPFDAPMVGLWLGPGAHLVHYPVRGGKELNVVVVTNGGSTAREVHQGSWNERADRTVLLALVRSWAKAPRSLLELAEGWRGWSLFRLAPLRRWSAGHMALLGDAAHPVLPFLGQGAALAIEDAATLVDCLKVCRDDPSLAFLRYEALRRKRAAAVQRASARMGRLYHLGAPLSFARNVVLQSRRPANLLAGFDWLYGAKLDETTA